jgi:hypothetical protein
MRRAINPGPPTTWVPVARTLARVRGCSTSSVPAGRGQVRQNVAPLARSPSLDERAVESLPEGSSVALDLVVPGHPHTVLLGSEGPPPPAPRLRP